MARPRAIYIHIPFCVSKCFYCTFLSFKGRHDLHERYVDAVCEELHRKSFGLRPRTIYIGGGTPTQLAPELLERLFACLARECDLTGLREFTVEANPGVLDEDKIRALKNGGVNRVSLGAQTFNEELLIQLGRTHTASQTREAVELLRASGFDNISLDLIFGAPGQTIETVKSDIDEIIKLDPLHVSTYCLMVHKETLMGALIESGAMKPVDDEIQREMYGLIIGTLARASFKQYELSNFAKSYRRAKHNLVYWRNEPYLGIGLGAVGYDGASRYTNTRDIEEYVGGRFDPAESETLPPRKAAQEALILALRLTKGVSCQDFVSRTGFNLDDFINDPVRRFIEQGFLSWNGRRLKLTRKAYFVSDEILQHFLD